MSSSRNPSSQMEEETSQNADTDKPSPELKANGKDEIITPPPSNIEPSDYSDTPSVASPQQRRHKRGGRKINHTAELPRSVSELDISADRRSEQDVPSGSEEMPEGFKSNDYDEDKLEEARFSRASGSKQRSQNRGSKADTGIRTFNLKKAESSGGRRPFDITIDSPKPKSQAPSQTKKESGGERSQENQQEKDEQDEKDEDGQERERKKCVSIRFDLNLEIEVFLKAKIRGDITMTFLE